MNVVVIRELLWYVATGLMPAMFMLMLGSTWTDVLINSIWGYLLTGIFRLRGQGR